MYFCRDRLPVRFLPRSLQASTVNHPLLKYGHCTRIYLQRHDKLQRIGPSDRSVDIRFATLLWLLFFHPWWSRKVSLGTEIKVPSRKRPLVWVVTHRCAGVVHGGNWCVIGTTVERVIRRCALLWDGYGAEWWSSDDRRRRASRSLWDGR